MSFNPPPKSRLLPVVDPCIPLQLDDFIEPGHALEVEIGCGKGRFLTARASQNRDTRYLGIERMLTRVRKLEKKADRLALDNIRILRLEAFYSFYYLLPRHRIRTVYVFFPDPWPKRHHHGRRLFSPLFLDALWTRLEIGGTLQLATDHSEYFQTAHATLLADRRFHEIPAMQRTEHEETEFEHIFRKQDLPIWQCAFQTLPATEITLTPLTINAELEPRADRLPHIPTAS